VSEKNLESEIAGGPIRSAERSMKRSFAGVRFSVVRVGAAFKEELTQAPVAMKCCGIEAEVVTQRTDRDAVPEKEFHGADVAVVGTPVD